MSGGRRVPPTRPVVSNSGPLIALATIGKLALLEALFEQIVISQAVFNEVVVQGKGEPGSTEIAEAGWIDTVQIRDQLAFNLLQESLDAGESEAIVLAQESEAAFLLLDDALARRKARLIGLRVLGTLGVLLMAKEAGLVSAIRPILEELRSSGFWMSDRVYQEVLAKAAEA